MRAAARATQLRVEVEAARYDMAPATRDFGYVPQVSIAEGLRRLAADCHPA